MDTIVRNVVTLSITIHCSYSKAFEYLSIPIHQKEWAIHFFKDIEEIDGKTIATLPFGKVSMNIISDDSTGIIDNYLGDGKPTRTRLINIEENLIQYNFTLAQPEGMPEHVWKNVALPNMQEELKILKSILEKK